MKLHLSTTRLPNGKRKLNHNFLVTVSDTLYIVPEGFTTDFSSYPWFTRILVRFDRVDLAGVVHDWLYYSEMEDRRTSDYVWREVAMMGDHKANKLQAWLSWIGLRAFGWYAWNQHRNSQK